MCELHVIDDFAEIQLQRLKLQLTNYMGSSSAAMEKCLQE